MSDSPEDGLLPLLNQQEKFHPYPFWTPRFWNGMRLRDWWRLASRHRFDVHPTRWPMFCAVTSCALINSTLARLQHLFYSQKIDQTTIHPSPLFIIGHWRSGTTYLHELLSLDERYTSPSTYQCFVPHHFLLSQWWLSRMIWIPSRRPMDNVKLGWKQPQEDEFAICIMGAPSPYSGLAFPNHPPEYSEYLNMAQVPAEDLRQWKETFLRFMRLVSCREPKPLLLKSPTHTGRIRVLLELFPEAKFVHIVRDPFAVIPSTFRLWQSLQLVQGLQRPKFQHLVDYVFEAFDQMYQGFESAQQQVGPQQMCTVRYERLVRDPVTEVASVYDQLQLGDFASVRPKLNQYACAAKEYQTNRHPLPPRLRDEIARRCAGFIERYGYEADGG
jgi:hypothetical protein